MEQTGDLDREARDPDVRAVLASLKQVLGNFSATVDVTDRGLAMWSSIELR